MYSGGDRADGGAKAAAAHLISASSERMRYRIRLDAAGSPQSRHPRRRDRGRATEKNWSLIFLLAMRGYHAQDLPRVGNAQ